MLVLCNLARLLYLFVGDLLHARDAALYHVDYALYFVDFVGCSKIASLDGLLAQAGDPSD
jgi:hypothetical protein